MPLALMALVGTLGFNFQVVLPLLARFSFDGGAGAYAALVSAMAVGSIAGALVTGSHGRTGPRLIAAARARLRRRRPARGGDAGAGLEVAVLALLGAAAVTFAATINSTLQLAVAPADARPGDGPLLGRLPRLDPDRRPPGRLALPSLRPALRPAPGRRLRPLRRLGGPSLLRRAGLYCARRAVA